MVRVQELTVGEVYRNRNGWDYLCLENAGPGVVVLERVSDGWTLLAHGICVYEAEKEGEARCLNCQSTSGSF